MHSRGDSTDGQRRTKRRHDPLLVPQQDEASGSGTRTRKGVAKKRAPRRGGHSGALDPRLSIRQDQFRRGKQPALDICNRTPDRLEAVFCLEQQKAHPYFPRLSKPVQLSEYQPRLPKDYTIPEFKREIKQARGDNPYIYKKDESIDFRFWCQFHWDFYNSVILASNKNPVVPMQWIDLKHLENLDDPIFDQVLDALEAKKLKDIVSFRFDWNFEILGQFYASYYYKPSEDSIFWTTQGQQYTIDYLTFSRILGFGSKDAAKSKLHDEGKWRDSDIGILYMDPSRSGGETKFLKPVFYHLNNIFRHTILPKVGDTTHVYGLARNLLMRMAPGGEPFSVGDFLWNELRLAISDHKRSLPYAPYIMYIIERVTKLTFGKDRIHEGLQLKKKSGSYAPPSHQASFRQPSYHGASASRSSSSSSRGKGIKAVLKSIFNICKSTAVEVNENRRDILEIKTHLGLPAAPYRPVPDFPNPFALWEEAEAAATRAQEEEEDIPAPSRPSRSTRARPSYSHHEIEEEIEEEEDTEEDVQGYKEHDDDDEDDGETTPDDDNDDDYE